MKRGRMSGGVHHAPGEDERRPPAEAVRERSARLETAQTDHHASHRRPAPRDFQRPAPAAVVGAPGAQGSVVLCRRPPGRRLTDSTNVESGTSGIPSKTFESCAPAKLTLPTRVTGTAPASLMTRLASPFSENARMTGPL